MGKDKSAAGGVVQNKTPKFAVLDFPGVTQPEVVVETTADASSAVGGSGKTTKDGLQGRRATQGAGPKITKPSGGVSIGGDSFVKRVANPSWLQDRVAAYEEIKARRMAELQAKTLVPMSVTLPDGKVLEQNKAGEPFLTYKTTPFEVAVVISQGLADNATVARVTYEYFAPDYNPAEDGMEAADFFDDEGAAAAADSEDGAVNKDTAKVFLWDMTRPLVGTVAKMEFLKFDDDKEAKTVFWHSSAHMMGEALEHLFGSKLTIGPPLAGGFYYDSYMGNEEPLRDSDCKCIYRPGPSPLSPTSAIHVLSQSLLYPHAATAI
jgi:threonyl-tRNA synthetase